MSGRGLPPSISRDRLGREGRYQRAGRRTVRHESVALTPKEQRHVPYLRSPQVQEKDILDPEKGGPAREGARENRARGLFSGET